MSGWGRATFGDPCAERGVIGLDDVVKTSGHDALHHEWDIERSLTA